MERAAAEEYRARVRGCLLGGAIGDALGGPVEFDPLAKILADHPDGVRSFVSGGPGWPPGTITDDTQMTLFTAEGMIRAGVRTDRGLGFTLSVLHNAYDRWLDTQLLNGPKADGNGWLQAEEWLYARRAPGNTCLGALTEARRNRQIGQQAVNDSKGCGGVMRVAPIGLLPPGQANPRWTFDAAAEAAGFTHGHPTGKLASGALAVLIRALVEGAALTTAVDWTLGLLAEYPGHEETSRAIIAAREAPAQAIEQLGGGWVAEEALAIGLYAALAHPGPDEVLDALALAVTHSGDSDSTGAICGNILGALHGEPALPAGLAASVEGRATICQLADDLVLEFTAPQHTPEWVQRYPGS